jgi:predicted amidophosphoribosyltransferase
MPTFSKNKTRVCERCGEKLTPHKFRFCTRCSNINDHEKMDERRKKESKQREKVRLILGKHKNGEHHKTRYPKSRPLYEIIIPSVSKVGSKFTGNQ